MAETLVVGCDHLAKWRWSDVMEDLKVQGGLPGVFIDPLSVNAHGCGGEYAGNLFYFTWVQGKFLLLTMQVLSQPLVDAFEKVVEYQPFCRYSRGDGSVTVEWDKENPSERLIELGDDPDVSSLVSL